MNVILDTNIFREDFMMASSKFKILFDYLKKTNSKIILPKIVYEEIAAVYERELNNRLQALQKAQGLLQRALIVSDLQEPKISINEEVKYYLDFLKVKLELTDNDMIPYKDNYLSEIVYRATHRIKPCSETGEEFRDALLWLTTLDVANTSEQKMIVFISNNIKQFASVNDHLHPSLLNESESKGLKIRFYSSLINFIKDHASKIDYITDEWLASVLSLDKVNERLVDMLEKHGESELLEWACRQGKDTTGYVNPLSSSIYIDDFYVYEMIDGSLYVQASLSGEIEVEFKLEEEVEDREWKLEFRYDALGDDYGFEPVFGSRAKTQTIIKCMCPEIEITIGINIRNKQVENFEILTWSFV